MLHGADLAGQLRVEPADGGQVLLQCLVVFFGILVAIGIASGADIREELLDLHHVVAHIGHVLHQGIGDILFVVGGLVDALQAEQGDQAKRQQQGNDNGNETDQDGFEFLCFAGHEFTCCR